MIRDKLIAMVHAYFAGVDGEDIEQIFGTLAEDCRFSVETHRVDLVGREEITGMFDRLWSNHAAVHHEDFKFVVDAEEGKIAAQFRVVNILQNGNKVYKSNCNFFSIRKNRFNKVAVYMAGENTLDHAS